MLCKCIKTIFVCCSIFCIIGCGPTLKFTSQTFTSLDPSTQSKQEIDNISIEMTVLPDNEYEKSIYKQQFKVISLGEITNVEWTIPYFDSMSAFEVTIINNTPHIIRMRDSRVVYIDPSSNEPQTAIDRQSAIDDIEDLPSYASIFNLLKQKYSETKPDFLKEQLSKAMITITKKQPFISGFNQEIMPSMRLKGIIVFPISPVQTAQGKISFIDMVSETDPAGNPTKRVRFDFRTTTIDRFWRYNSATDKGWVEIKKEEYDSRPKN